MDSDDYVEPDMYQRLYEAARRNDCDIAIGQFFHHKMNGKTDVRPAIPFSEDDVVAGRDFLLRNNIMVVWNKLYSRSLIEAVQFPVIWFEDVAWTPVIMSRARRTCYVKQPLYHWVRRDGSIASSQEDPRTLQGLHALSYALDKCDAANRNVVAYMAARRLLFEMRIRPGYADRYATRLNDIASLLRDNPFVLNDDHLLRSVTRLIEGFRVIPKRIYYSHFGDRPFTRVQKACVDSWSLQLTHSDGEVIRLDESNCDINENVRIRELYNSGKWSLVGDYFALRRVMQHGGVAIRTNMMGHGFIAPHLICGALFSHAPDWKSEAFHGGVLGGTAGHPAVEEVHDWYMRLLAANTEEPDPLSKAIGHCLINKYGAEKQRRTRILKEGVVIHEAGVFCSRLTTDLNVTEEVPDTETMSKEEMRQGEVCRTAYIRELLTAKEQARLESVALRKRLAVVEKELSGIKGLARWRLASRLPSLPHYLRPNSSLRSFPKAIKSLHSSRRSVLEDPAIGSRTKYASDLQKLSVTKNLVLLEAGRGQGASGTTRNLFAAWAQREDFRKYDFVWVLDDHARRNEVIGGFEAQYANVEFVARNSREHLRLLAQARFVISDDALPGYYIKRSEQTYIHTNGVKLLSSFGDVAERHWSEMRSLLACDVLVCSKALEDKREVEGRSEVPVVCAGKVTVIVERRNECAGNDDDSALLDRRVLEHVLEGVSVPVTKGRIRSERKSLLFNAGGLDEQAMVDKLHGLTSLLGSDCWEVWVLTTKADRPEVHECVKELSTMGAHVMTWSSDTSFTPLERYLLSVLDVGTPVLLRDRVLRRAFEREWVRCFGHAHFNVVVNLDAESPFFASLLRYGNADIRVGRIPSTALKNAKREMVSRIYGSYDATFSKNQEFVKMLNEICETL